MIEALPPEQPPGPTSPAVLSVETDFAVDRQIWAWLQAHGRLLAAGGLALLLHTAVLTLGIQRQATVLQRQPREELTVRLQAPAGARGQVLTAPGARAVLPASPPRQNRQRAVRREDPKRGQEVTAALQVRAAPPPLLEYWAYAQPDYGYWGWRDLDRLAAFSQEPDLQYPPEAEAMGLPGRVVARAYINERGLVDRVEITEAVPPGVFESAVLQAIYPLQFQAAERAGSAVKSFKELEFQFSQDGTVGIADTTANTD